jgi:hypothetical protein
MPGQIGAGLPPSQWPLGDLQHELLAQQAELERETARRAENPGPVEDAELDRSIADRTLVIQQLAKAIRDYDTSS